MPQADGAEVMASNQDIGEASIALQQYYGMTKAEARGGLAMVSRSDLVSPANDLAVFASRSDLHRGMCEVKSADASESTHA